MTTTGFVLHAPDARGRSWLRVAARAGLALAVLLLASAVLLPLAAVPEHARSRVRTALLQHFSRLLLRVIGITVERTGSPFAGPCLVVANHVSWLDVLVLAAAAPMVPVTRAEVGGWPLLGSIIGRLGAVFVHRDHPRELPRTVATITGTLRRGQRVLVFPQTVFPQTVFPQTVFSQTAIGRVNELHPFRRAAFQAAVDAAVVIAPVTLAYRAANSGRVPATDIAENDVLGSLGRILRAGPVTACVRWLPVIPAAVGTEHRSRSRALAARRAEWAVAAALGKQVIGRRAVPPRVAGRPVPEPPSRQVA